jgi:hypothetical protein
VPGFTFDRTEADVLRHTEMSGYVSSLRSATVSLVALAIFASTVFGERCRLLHTLLRIEPELVTLELLRLPALEPRLTPESAKTETLQRVYEAYRDRGEIYALGEAMQVEGAVDFVHQTDMVGGGDLYFSAEPVASTTDVIAQIRTDPECAARGKPNGFEDRVFYLPIRVFRERKLHSDLIGPGFDVVITNAQYHEDGQCLAPGDLWAALRSEVTHYPSNRFGELELMRPGTLEASILISARPLGSTGRDANAVYSDLRSRYESQRIRLPLLSSDVDAVDVLAAATALEMALLAWAAFVLRSLARGETREDEPWIVVEPLHAWRRTTRAHRLSAAAEIGLFTLFNVGAILAPLVIAIASLLFTGRRASPWSFAADALMVPVIIVLTLSAFTSYAAIFRRAMRSNPPKS